MQMKSILLSVGITLAAGQQAATGAVSPGDGANSNVPFSPFGQKHAGENHKCRKVPSMPKTFYFKRKFASLTNTIILSDHSGKELGYVQSWLLDWKNLFGFPGASFYLHAPPAAPVAGEFSLHPKAGADGWASANQATLAKDVNDQTLLDASLQTQRRQGGGAFRTENVGAKGGKADNRLVASMTGKRDLSGVFSNEMHITDCQGKPLFTAGENNIKVHDAGKDAKWRTKRSNSANQLFILDEATPASEIAEITMEQPCWPFPPFCQHMGKFDWTAHGYEYQGEILAPNFNADLSTGGMEIETAGGAGTDMRFLALYSAYQFSNTRWSPLMLYVGYALLVLFCIGCCGLARCLVRCICGDGKKVAEKSKHAEETKTLIQKEEPKKDSIWACCSRKQGPRVVP